MTNPDEPGTGLSARQKRVAWAAGVFASVAAGINILVEIGQKLF